MLPNELDQAGDYLTPQENENPPKASDGKIKYESSSANSSISSDEALDKQTSNKNKQTKDQDELKNAANEIENDLNDLAAMIHEASKLSNEKENSEPSNNNIPKRHTFDEDDDTSKQATQNYDLHDNEQEVRIVFFY
jgi:hypothetical protein